MNKISSGISACRHCRFYQLEGRRGGHCKQLGAPVQSSWSACSLAVPLFAEHWEEVLLPSVFEPMPEPVSSSTAAYEREGELIPIPVTVEATLPQRLMA